MQSYNNNSTDDDLKNANALVKKLLKLKDKRNNLLMDPPGSFAPDRIKELAASMKTDIEKVEKELQETDKRLANKHKSYHAVSPESPSFLEPRTLKSSSQIKLKY